MVYLAGNQIHAIVKDPPKIAADKSRGTQNPERVGRNIEKQRRSAKNSHPAKTGKQRIWHI